MKGLRKKTIAQKIKTVDQKIQKLRDQEARLDTYVIPHIRDRIDRLQHLKGKLEWRKKLAESPPEIRKLLKVKDGEKRFATAIISLMRERINIAQFEELLKGALIDVKHIALPIWMTVMLSKKVGWLEEELRKMKSAYHRN